MESPPRVSPSMIARPGGGLRCEAKRISVIRLGSQDPPKMRQGALRVSADQKPSQMHADTNAVGIGGQGNLKGGHHAGIWIWHSRLFDLPRRLLEALALDRPDPLRPRGVATKSFIVLVDVGTLSGAERCSANDSRQPGEEGRLPSQTSASNTMSSSRFWSASFSERVRHPRRRSPLASANVSVHCADTGPHQGRRRRLPSSRTRQRVRLRAATVVPFLPRTVRAC